MNINEVLSIANNLNVRFEKTNLDVPILNGLKIIPIDNQPNLIFLAKDDIVIEQFLCDGTLNNNETFEDRINNVLNSNSKSNNDNLNVMEPKYIRDYGNDIFNYKIYSQDLVINNTKVIKQVYAFFVDKNTNTFYQISLSMGQFNIEEFNNDNISNELYNMLILIIHNIKYAN